MANTLLSPPQNLPVVDKPDAVYWFDGGILYYISKNTPTTLDDNKKTIAEFKNINGGKKFCMMLDFTNAAPSNKHSRNYAAKEIPGIVNAVAMVTKSPVGKMLATLFLAVKPSPYPAKIFTNEDEAKAWLTQYFS